MKYIIGLFMAFCIAVPAFASSAASITDASPVAGITDNSRIRALLARAKALMDMGKFDEAKEKLETILELQPGHAEATSLLDACNRELERELRAERTAYNEACAKGTAEALRQFISDYPSSQFASEARLRIEDYALWESARRSNTIAAYNDYLSSSSVKAFRLEAEHAIKDLERQQDWERVKNSENIDEIEEHLSRYPDSPGLTEARWRLNWLKGERHYAQGNKTAAMEYYAKARQTDNLPPAAQRHYEEIVAEQEYQRMLESTDVLELQIYLSSLPASSSYSNPISNRIALLKAQLLDQVSTDSDYTDAMSYARDKATANAVTGYIEKAKDANRKHRRYMRRLAHENWWDRNLNFGWHMVGVELWEKFLALRSGLRVKLGTHQDVFNIQVGADYVWCANTDSYTSRSGKNEVSYEPICHQIVFPLNIKLNFTGGESKCSFYIGCAGEYGYTLATATDYKDLCNDYTLAYEPQIGLNWKHADFGIFWRKYINGKSIMKDDVATKHYDQRCGMYLTVYF